MAGTACVAGPVAAAAAERGGVRRSCSRIRALQRRSFDGVGIEAWRTNTVPSYVTANPFIAGAYVELVRAFAADGRRAAPSARPGAADAPPLTVVELGAGSGRFARFFPTRLRARTAAGLFRRAFLMPVGPSACLERFAAIADGPLATLSCDGGGADPAALEGAAPPRPLRESLSSTPEAEAATYAAEWLQVFGAGAFVLTVEGANGAVVEAFSDIADHSEGRGGVSGSLVLWAEETPSLFDEEVLAGTAFYFLAWGRPPACRASALRCCRARGREPAAALGRGGAGIGRRPARRGRAPPAARQFGRGSRAAASARRSGPAPRGRLGAGRKGGGLRCSPRTRNTCCSRSASSSWGWWCSPCGRSAAA